MALAGAGYWSLVAMAVSLPAVSVVLVWLATGWIPGAPRRGTNVWPMLHYGGLLTINGLVVYLAYNADKVLIGRFWGAETLGVYGRAYQLISLPTENLQSTVGWVMFPALSRVQGEPERTRGYFMKGYGLFLSVVMPITVACWLLAEDIVRVLLGPMWGDAVPVFRLLAPTILAFALINPFAQLMQAGGHALRSLKLAFLIAPVVMVGYLIGLPYGPNGVALGFSTAMVTLVVPVVYWARKGTLITAMDLFRTALPPFLSTAIASVVAFAAVLLCSESPPLLRLVVATVVLFTTHALVLLFGMGQKDMYVDVLHAIRGDAPASGQ
jgi:PST family polysaccharide transporter